MNKTDGHGIFMTTAQRVCGLLLTTLLLLHALPTHADAREQLSSSLHGKVGDSALAAMLDASNTGNFYQILPEASEVRFSVDSIAGEAKGNFTRFKGVIALQPDSANNGQAVFVLKSDSISSANIAIDKVVKSKSYLNTARFPEILFISSGFAWLSATKGLLKGKLTLHGVTENVAFNAELSDARGNKVGDSETIHVSIDTSISRSRFGMKLMSSVVSDAVRLSLNIRAKRVSGISKAQLVAMCSYPGK
jgi:polyisoprenoid-binding protein YceI